MFTKRQLEIISGLARAGLKDPNAGFEISRELIDIGQAAEADVAAAAAIEHEKAVLAEAEQIAARKTGKKPA